MTAKFDAFIEALEALCVEHGILMRPSTEWDDYSTYLELATEDSPAGCEVDFVNVIPPRPEEIAAEEARQAEAHAKWVRQQEEGRKRWEAIMASPAYQAMKAEAIMDANRKREDYMRITKDPNDTAHFDDRPRRVWVNDREILDWTVADEFRRVVQTANSVHNGAVRIERLPEPGAPVVEPAPVAGTDLTGMFVAVPDPKPEAPKVEEPKPQANPVPQYSPKAGKRRK
jgi:hypothetical protein